MEAPVSRSAPRMEGPNRGPAAGSGLSLRGHSDCKMSEGASDDSDDDDSLGSGEAAAGAVAMAQGGGPGRDGVSGGGGPCFPGRDPMDPGRGVAPTGLKPGKKTRGRVKIKMEFIDNKLRRYTTFSKRKTGIMKKAYELSTLTGTQVMLLVASETGHVYTFATRKLQPMITSESGKALIQTCLNSPDSPPRPTAAAATAPDPGAEQRMSASGFEETELSYQIGEPDIMEDSKESLKPTLFTITNFPGSSPGPHHFSSPSYSPPSSSAGPPTSMAGGHMVGRRTFLQDGPGGPHANARQRVLVHPHVRWGRRFAAAAFHCPRPRGVAPGSAAGGGVGGQRLPIAGQQRGSPHPGHAGVIQHAGVGGGARHVPGAAWHHVRELPLAGRRRHQPQRGPRRAPQRLPRGPGLHAAPPRPWAHGRAGWVPTPDVRRSERPCAHPYAAPADGRDRTDDEQRVADGAARGSRDGTQARRQWKL
ncbi:unnamed protein product, partial [Lampetra fluviatilis]